MNVTPGQRVEVHSVMRAPSQRDAIAEFGRWLEDSRDSFDDLIVQLGPIRPRLGRKIIDQFNLAQDFYGAARRQLTDHTVDGDDDLRHLLDQLERDLVDAYRAAELMVA